jgi:pimeloyl-ACP methyl ester carboxylesterase
MSPLQTTPTWQHQFIDTNGIRLHYVTQGTGPLLLCLHGFPEFWYSWRHQIPVFADSFTVVALDLRGYNDSDTPEAVRDYAMTELVKDIEGVIMGLGYDRCFLAGHDWGGAIAWNVAYDRSDLIEKLMILNCPHPQRFMDGLSYPGQWFRSAYMAFFQLPWLPETVLKMNDYQFLLQAFDNLAVNRSAISETDMQAYKTAIAKPGALQAGLNYYRNLFSPPLWRREWPILEVPTLMIWGEDDPAFESTLAADTEDYVRDFHLRYIPQCGHWVTQEYPDLVNQYMAEFLQVPVVQAGVRE